MKKFSVFLLLILSLLGTACTRPIYEQPWDTFCYKADAASSPVELSAKESGYVIDLLNNAENPTYDIAKCPSDYTFHTQRQSLGYNCEEGIFNDFTRKISIRISEEDRIKLNDILYSK